MGRFVHFSREHCRVHEIPTLDELTDDEYNDTYFSPLEYLSFRKRERKLLRRLKMVGDVGDEDDPLGIESKAESLEKHVFIDCARLVVMRGQSLSIEMNQPMDIEAVAELYSEASEESCSRAYMRAVSVHAQLVNTGRSGGRRRCQRWSMDMRAPTTMQQDRSLEFSKPVRRRGAVTAPGGPPPITMPESALQSPCQSRWSPKEKVQSFGLGMPVRRIRTPQQCSGRKRLDFEPTTPSLVTPAL
eukprot:scaffold12607_cov114-Cylindrotheca_fusiformis.AAC.2